jgi:hypothetical protein
MEISGSYWQTCTLHAAVKLDLFSAIDDGQVDTGTLAEALDCEKDSLERLLNAAAAMGLLVKTGNRYANAPGCRRFLSRHSQQYIGYIIMHHQQLVESWANLDVAVKTGSPVRQRASKSDESWRQNFLLGMFNIAMNLAPRIVPLIDLGGRRQLLDLGGGPGTYAIHFCRENPELKATVFDLPTTRPFAEETIRKFGLSDRIDFREGNYLVDELVGGYDVAWLSHILHGEGQDDCRQIIGKAVEALNPGGMILIHEFILDNTMDAPLFPALFSLNMLLGTSSGRAYSEEQLTGMLGDAGVKNINRIRFDTPTDSSILAGVTAV